MFEYYNVTAKDVFDDPRRFAIISACNPVNGFTLSLFDDSWITYSLPNSLISWSGRLLDSQDVDHGDCLGSVLCQGGAKDLALLRFPRRFAWGTHVEAFEFWEPLLPVQAVRILFTSMDMNYVYVQLVTGHILFLSLKFDGEDVSHDELAYEVIAQIFQLSEVMK